MTSKGQGVMRVNWAVVAFLKNVIRVMLVAAALIDIGCVSTYTRLDRYGVRGQAVDSETKRPLPETKLRVVVDGERVRTRTDNMGDFATKPRYTTHLTWLGGPVFPPATGARIEVFLHGYEVVCIRARDGNVHGHLEPVESFPIVQSEGDYFLLGTITMRKR